MARPIFMVLGPSPPSVPRIAAVIADGVSARSDRTNVAASVEVAIRKGGFVGINNSAPSPNKHTSKTPAMALNHKGCFFFLGASSDAGGADPASGNVGALELIQRAAMSAH